MATTVITSDQNTLLQDELRRHLRAERPQTLGIASAFVTVAGVEVIDQIIKQWNGCECRLVAGTNHYITHPTALRLACDLGWQVRIASKPPPPGIFHPKLLVGGNRFARDGSIRDTRIAFVGSANLTGRGMSRNTECGHLATGADCTSDASTAFATYWRLATRATKKAVADYEAGFADRSRSRSLSELESLGVSDSATLTARTTRTRRGVRPTAVFDTRVAVAAWAGLESFTGEYRFQIEFPRSAGEVVTRLIRGRAQQRGAVDVYCPDDSRTISMQYRYYTDNGMFRLNVPNDVGGVAWAREEHRGLALVGVGPTGGAPLRLTILRPGVLADEIMTRSQVLGTWGQTRTRLYGWY